MPKRLTEPTIQSEIAKAKSGGVRREVADAALEGLRLRISSNGRATWALACRDQQGRMRRFGLGHYPGVGLSLARDRARKLRVEVRENGRDPVAEARSRRAAAMDAKAGIGTLRALLAAYGSQEGRERKSWGEACRRIEHVFSAHLDRPAITLKRADLQLTADAHPARQSASAAVRYLRPVLKWGAKRDLVAREIAMIEPPAVVKRRERVLSREELKRLLPALEESRRPYAKAMLFALYTLARREEICSARWQDVNLETAEWIIPDTKPGRQHKVPLSSQAAALLEAEGPGAPETLIFSTSTGKPLGNWHRETLRVQKASETANWHRHDLRRTAATLLGELGVEPHVIEAALNHADLHSGLASVYNRARYLPAVREALGRLGELLTGLTSGAADIVALRRA
jgi:integrase